MQRPPMQRTHKRETPLTPTEVDQAREVERQRQKWDPTYITAEQAKAMPPEVASRPDVSERIRYSQEDWPENRMAASVALDPLQPGAGEEYLRKDQVEASDLFTGEVSGGCQPAGSKE